jgi:hypothetical protein
VDEACEGGEEDEGDGMSAWSSEVAISIGISMYDVLRTQQGHLRSQAVVLCYLLLAHPTSVSSRTFYRASVPQIPR